MTDKIATDWERIEQLYRAGTLSVREIASTCSVSHVAIHKRAKRDGWERDLQAKIKAKADSLVNTELVNTEVNKEALVTERRIVEANAQVIASIRIAHRTDIGRYRKLANTLLEELEGITEERATIKELIDQLKDSDEADGALLDLASKIASLPNRTKVMKELGETLKNLIALERQAYNVDAEQPQDDRSKLTEDELDRRIAKLSGIAG
ncbi:hypothetical protein [Pseudomonas sp. 32_A]|uniref:hypothetical protein n=1 Tax=Pseudomonas sp. 32_A TaxID=2813559 RepID=UPI001A9D2194|nr:hypothetical protein [Pseudomonas sp. 32_A]